jgi:hypothetical protein
VQRDACLRSAPKHPQVKQVFEPVYSHLVQAAMNTARAPPVIPSSVGVAHRADLDRVDQQPPSTCVQLKQPADTAAITWVLRLRKYPGVHLSAVLISSYISRGRSLQVLNYRCSRSMRRFHIWDLVLSRPLTSLDSDVTGLVTTGARSQQAAAGRWTLQVFVPAWCMYRRLLSNMQAGVEKSITSLAV